MKCGRRGSNARAKYELASLPPDDRMALENRAKLRDLTESERNEHEIKSLKETRATVSGVVRTKTSTIGVPIWVPKDYKKERNNAKSRRDGRYVEYKTVTLKKGHMMGKDLRRFAKISRLSHQNIAKLLNLERCTVSLYAKRRSFYLSKDVSDKLQWLFDHPERYRNMVKSKGRYGNLLRAEIDDIVRRGKSKKPKH
jgi:hypothetical protein